MATSAKSLNTVIIGGAQAGLATGYHLAKQGRPFVILDASERIGDPWRKRWDSLRLYSPAGYDGLPGMPFPAKRASFPTTHEMADYLEAYASTLRPSGALRHDGGDAVEGGRPVRGHRRRARRSRQTTWWSRRVSCRSRSSRASHRSSIRASGSSIRATTATSRSSRPAACSLSERATPEPTSRTRRRRSTTPPVGAGHWSDTGIGRDAPRTHALPRTVLPRVARPHRGHAARPQDAPAHPSRRRSAPALQEEGSARRGGREGARAHHRRAGWHARARGRPRRRRSERHLVHRVQAGLLLDPDSVRGRRDSATRSSTAASSSSAPGLYFVGLLFLHSFTSMLIGGAGRDAARVAKHIATRPARVEAAATSVAPIADRVAS